MNARLYRFVCGTNWSYSVAVAAHSWEEAERLVLVNTVDGCCVNEPRRAGCADTMQAQRQGSLGRIEMADFDKEESCI